MMALLVIAVLLLFAASAAALRAMMSWAGRRVR